MWVAAAAADECDKSEGSCSTRAPALTLLSAVRWHLKKRDSSTPCAGK